MPIEMLNRKGWSVLKIPQEIPASKSSVRLGGLSEEGKGLQRTFLFSFHNQLRL